MQIFQMYIYFQGNKQSYNLRIWDTTAAQSSVAWWELSSMKFHHNLFLNVLVEAFFFQQWFYRNFCESKKLETKLTEDISIK